MHFPLSDKLPTRQHCLKVKRYLNPIKSRNAIIYHRGGVDKVRDNTDVELDFRQESNFFYLTGVAEAGFHVIFDLESELVHLVPPTIPDSEVLWMGAPDSPETLLKKYDVDRILEEQALAAFLGTRQPNKVFVLDITDTTALLQAGLPPEKLDYFSLQSAIEEARLVKFPWEIDLVRYAAHVSSHAHIELMQHVAAGQFEWELEARFRWICAKNGAKWQCYIPIIASGPRAATLHYTRNNERIPNSRHALVLADAGGECRCYGSDVTRTFPVTGTFSEEAKTIYEIVLKAQEAVLSRLKAGVMWMDMHLLAIEILCTELVRIGILRGDPKELIRLGVYRAFYFHGTGHSVGLDVHDVGGRSAGVMQSNQYKEFVPQEALLGRPLEENMVVTVEPGLYFNETSLNMWIKVPGFAEYFDIETIKRYWPVGGVRIEDTVVITADGIENLTIAPKRVKDIEAIMARRGDK